MEVQVIVSDVQVSRLDVVFERLGRPARAL